MYKDKRSLHNHSKAKKSLSIDSLLHTPQASLLYFQTVYLFQRFQHDHNVFTLTLSPTSSGVLSSMNLNQASIACSSHMFSSCGRMPFEFL